jgi:hypothetical protein
VISSAYLAVTTLRDLMKALLKMFAVGLALSLSAGPALAQAEPFTTAPHDIAIKHNADARAIIDSKRFDINMQTGARPTG